MDARKAAAQFAAYVWIENARQGNSTETEKCRFARDNWQPFMPIANEGLGRLLLDIARGRRERTQRRQSFRRQNLTAAG
jgi:hypothetical protein